MSNSVGYIYILTNPSFPQYVKIGYADDVEKRLVQLNRSECVPFAFRLFAYYKVGARLTDMKLHSLIDKLNPNLRSIEDFKGKRRVREFYAMDAHDAYSILETIAEINNLKENLVLVEPSEKDVEDDDSATEIRTRRSPKQLPKLDWLIEQGIVHIGDKVCIINRPDETAEIVDKENVNYKGKIMSLNHFGLKITGWKTIQTYTMTKLVGMNDTLADLREKRINEISLDATMKNDK